MKIKDFELEKHEEDAVKIIQYFLNCYNDKDGIGGIATGTTRYSVFEQRVELAAARSQTVKEFWGCLRKNLMCGIWQKKADSFILPLFTLPNQGLIIRSIATAASETVAIARVFHDLDKKMKKELWLEQENHDFNFNNRYKAMK